MPLPLAFASSRRPPLTQRSTSEPDIPLRLRETSKTNDTRLGPCEPPVQSRPVPKGRTHVPYISTQVSATQKLHSSTPPLVSPVSAFRARSPTAPGIFVTKDGNESLQHCWVIGTKVAELSVPTHQGTDVLTRDDRCERPVSP